ncbi:MAG: hypothetical protein ACYCT0_12590 [Sulfobacillus sp.]
MNSGVCRKRCLFDHAAQETDRLAKLAHARHTLQQLTQTRQQLCTELSQLIAATDPTATTVALSEPMRTLLLQLRTVDQDQQAAEQRVHALQASVADPDPVGAASAAPLPILIEGHACVQCHSVIDYAARFCPACGAEQPSSVSS